MKSFSTLNNLFVSLSQNSSAENMALGQQLMSDQHRYLIQKYFDNERTVTTSTVGGQDLTLTGSLAAAATSATLTAVWAYSTGYQLTNFSNSDQRNVLYTNGSAAITWADGLTDTATTAISTVGQQYYNIPANVSKIKDDTITVGQLKFRPREIKTIQEWNDVNFLPYTSDIPQYYFIYNGQLGIFPVPSTTGNILTFNYKTRVQDFSTAFLFSDTSGAAYVAGSTTYDYQKGTISAATAGSTSITGASTGWSATGKFPTGVDISAYNLYFTINAPFGDGIWYPIYRFNSDTSLTLALPIVNTMNIASATYSIGQMPLLVEDFHDMIVQGSLKTYFTSIVPDTNRFKEFDALYQERLPLLAEYAGTKSVNVDLGEEPNPTNPNLFLYANN